jgi:hypothetical protein
MFFFHPLPISEKIEVKFYSEKRNTSETDPISLYFAYKRKKILSETGAPYFVGFFHRAQHKAPSICPSLSYLNPAPIFKVQIFPFLTSLSYFFIFSWPGFPLLVPRH